MSSPRHLLCLGLFALTLAGARTANADMTVSPVIIDFAQASQMRKDVEVENHGKSRMYVVVEAARIDNPGQPHQRRVRDADPSRLGLLATPARLILEPGEKKLVRISMINPPADTDRVFRVIIKPLTGKLTSTQSAVKVVVGFDVLVVQRPAAQRDGIVAARTGQSIAFKNDGNTNTLLYDGKVCGADGKTCTLLPTKRLYPGNAWQLRLPRQGTVSYIVQSGSQSARKTF